MRWGSSPPRRSKPRAETTARWRLCPRPPGLAPWPPRQAPEYDQHHSCSRGVLRIRSVRRGGRRGRRGSCRAVREPRRGWDDTQRRCGGSRGAALVGTRNDDDPPPRWRFPLLSPRIRRDGAGHPHGHGARGGRSHRVPDVHMGRAYHPDEYVREEPDTELIAAVAAAVRGSRGELARP